MTNLSAEASTWKRHFSRERTLVGVPIFAALVIFFGLVLLDGWPRFGRLQDQHERLEELRLKQASLPGLRKQLARQEIRAQQVAQQQALIVDLIAGRDRIQTFLAEVGRVADATGVEISSYEPSKRPVTTPPPPSSSSRGKSKKSNQDAKPKDPLSELGYVKTGVLIKAKAPYESLQAFLRSMESLQLLVQSSDLALKPVSVANPKKVIPGVDSKPLTELKLRLNFFDRVAEPQSKGAETPRRP